VTDSRYSTEAQGAMKHVPLRLVLQDRYHGHMELIGMEFIRDTAVGTNPQLLCCSVPSTPSFAHCRDDEDVLGSSVGVSVLSPRCSH
jgi:hypothetical protein